MPPSVQLLVILVAIVAFWVIVMRPARRQQQKVQDLQRQLEVGQEVVLSAGIFGTITALDDHRVQLEVAPGTVLTVARQVVVRRAADQPGADPVTEAPRHAAETVDPAPEGTVEDTPGSTPGPDGRGETR